MLDPNSYRMLAVSGTIYRLYANVICSLLTIFMLAGAALQCSDSFKHLGMTYHRTLNMTASSEHAAIPMLAVAHRIRGFVWDTALCDRPFASLGLAEAYVTCQQTNFDPAQDQMLFAYVAYIAGTKNDHQRDIQAIHPSRWDLLLIEVRYCDDTQPEQQLAIACKST